MPLHPTSCPLDCPDACGVLVETGESGELVRLRGNPAHSWSRGSLCAKTSIYHELVLGPERLTQPLIRRGGDLVTASWGEALDRVVDGIGGLGSDLLSLQYGGNMGIVARRFPRRLLGALGATDTDGTICDATSTAGYGAVLGRVVGPDLERVEEADLLLLWGCDARRTVQHLMPRVKKLCERGVQVVVIDVYRTDTIKAVEAWGGQGLLVKPGTDAALALCLAELAFRGGHADLAFLKAQCLGAAEFRAEMAGRYSVEEVASLTGLDPAAILTLSAQLGDAQAAWIKTGVGWNRRRNGGMSMRAVCSLAAVLGIADRVHFESTDSFALDTSALDRPGLRPAGGRDSISQIALGKTLVEGDFKAAIVWGHNPAVTVPDSRRVREGLAREDLFLVVHELVLTETARLADVVLPATALTEHTDLYQSYGHRVLQLGRKACEPVGEQRSNAALFSELGQRLGLDRGLWDVTEESLVEELLASNISRFTSEELRRVRAGEPVKLAPLDQAGWGTPSGRIELVSEACEAAGEGRIATYVPDDCAGLTGRFWFHSAPSVATHNSTYSTLARHRARAGSSRVLVHPADAEELGLGRLARLSNERGALTLPVERCADQPRGMVRVDGFPDPRSTPEGLTSNALTSHLPSDLGGGNVQFSTRVDLTPVEE